MEAVKQLLANSANLSLVDKDGNAPLSLALSGDHIAIVKALLDAKASVNQRNNAQETSVTLAAKQNRVEILQVFLEVPDVEIITLEPSEASPAIHDLLVEAQQKKKATQKEQCRIM